jgi:hypothetical protein
MAGNFELTVKDYGTVARINGDTDRLVETSKDIAEDAAQQAAYIMRFLAPEGDSDIHVGYETLKSRIDWSRATWHPGGAGGGGFWEAAAGVTRSTMHKPDEDPAVYVYEGTGLFGPLRRLIVPRSGNFLVFIDKGKKVVTPYVKGQPPQRLWVMAAQDRANAVVASRLALLQARDATN